MVQIINGDNSLENGQTAKNVPIYYNRGLLSTNFTFTFPDYIIY